MAVDPKKILERVRLKGESTKKRVTLYLEGPLYKDFQKLCESESVSQVVEELIRDFVKAVKRR